MSVIGKPKFGDSGRWFNTKGILNVKKNNSQNNLVAVGGGFEKRSAKCENSKKTKARGGGVYLHGLFLIFGEINMIDCKIIQ